jgi:DNA-binding response OmpR family regulator
VIPRNYPATIPAGTGGLYYLSAGSEFIVELPLSEEVATVAHTGVGVVAAATEFRPEAVLLDIGLPEIDGFEVARRLRKQSGLDSVRLIAITGFVSELDRQRATEAGFDHFLVKPVSFATLTDLLNGCSHARQTALPGRCRPIPRQRDEVLRLRNGAAGGSSYGPRRSSTRPAPVSSTSTSNLVSCCSDSTRVSFSRVSA